VSLIRTGTAETATQRELVVTVEVTKPVYLRGEPVGVRIILRNDTDTPYVVHFPFSEQYTLFIARQTTNPSLGIVDVPPLRLSRRSSAQSVVVEPRQAVMFDDIWDQRTAGGVMASPGTYLIRGIFRGPVELISPDELSRRRQLGLTGAPALGRQLGVIHGRLPPVRLALAPVRFTIRN
jgi:hypothetical protein